MFKKKLKKKLKEALDVVKKSKEFGEIDEIKEIQRKIEEEIKKDHVLSEEDPEMKKISVLNAWLKDGKCESNKMKIRFYSKNYRGVHACRNIKVIIFDYYY